MKKIIIVLAAMLLLTGCGEGWKRTVKDFQSNYGGGINRTVTVFDYEGDTLKSWSGKFDVQFDTSGAGQVLFDRIENGQRKRVVIQGGIVINEEI